MSVINHYFFIVSMEVLVPIKAKISVQVSELF